MSGSLDLFFLNDTATTEIYTTVHTLSLHDALPISVLRSRGAGPARSSLGPAASPRDLRSEEHTSELQSRTVISYAVFCLKTKTKAQTLKPSTRTSSNDNLMRGQSED